MFEVDNADGQFIVRIAPGAAQLPMFRKEAWSIARARAAGVPVPEPSPLFWEYLSARVHDAVSVEAPPGAVKDWWGASARWATFPRLAAPLSVAAVALAVVAAVVLRPAPVEGPAQDAPSASLAADATAGSGAGADSDALVDDPTFELVSDLAGDIDFETAVAAGLASGSSAEHALIHMTSGELMELEELLKAEMAGSQVS